MKKFIDIEKIIKSKNATLYKWLPNFVVSYLKRIAHEDEINTLFDKYSDQKNAEFCNSILAYIDVNIEVQGLENIPLNGGVHFASNHPLGGMDALAIIKQVYQVRPDIKFIVNDILLNIEALTEMFVGVNKHGKTMKESLLLVDKLLGSDKAVFVFPAGLVSRRKKGVIEDFDWAKTFISRAKKHKKNIVPVLVEGKLSNFFYRLSNFRELIGLKINIEMLYLADELFKQRGKTIKITFGEPVDYLTFDKTKKDKEWAKWMKDKVYKLKDANFLIPK